MKVVYKGQLLYNTVIKKWGVIIRGGNYPLINYNNKDVSPRAICDLKYLTRGIEQSNETK